MIEDEIRFRSPGHASSTLGFLKYRVRLWRTDINIELTKWCVARTHYIKK